MHGMYISHFSLAHAPFSIAPDPRYLYMSDRHREALAHLLYGIDAGGGVVLLSGEIGTGKTTLCRSLLEQVPANCNVAYVFNPKQTVDELLETICSEFHIPKPDPNVRGGTRVWVDALNRFLLEQHAAGHNNVLVIDEAQNLAPDVLEQLRLLTNLETSERKLLQIILIGQPELRDMLAQPQLEQLAQRVIAHYHLGPLNEDETESYVQYRMTIAGLSGPSPFSRDAMRTIHRLSSGVPRRINLLCDRALLGAYAQGTKDVSKAMLEHAANELFIQGAKKKPQTNHAWRYALAGTAGAALTVFAIAVGTPYLTQTFPFNENIENAPPVAQENTAPVLASANVTTPSAPANTLLASAQTTQSQATAPTDNASPAASTFAGLRNEQAAIAQLGLLWDEELEETNPCAQAATASLFCYRSTGGLAELRQLDRPSVLTLHDGEGKPYYALLTSLNETGARLQVGDITQDVDMAHLTRHFRGEFLSLWRAPNASSTLILPGQQSPTVDWIAQHLASVHGTTAPQARQTFNAALQHQVKLFQQANGLLIDGVVGPVTFMFLNRVAGVVEPRLTAASGS